jgi:hypothetical protein
MELAALPVMDERKRLWTALKDLRAERPMILFETWTVENYVEDSELLCEDPDLRGIEFHMRHDIRQFEEVGDDIVIEPVWRVGWHVRGTDFGVKTPTHGAEDIEGGHVAYVYENPIREPADIDRLHLRSWRVDREASRRYADKVSDVFGDILPVSLHGTQCIGQSLTRDVFQFLGNDRLLFWVYDEPEAIHRIMALLRDDAVAYYKWLEQEELLGRNDHWTFVGSGSPGYTSSLPQADFSGTARLNDIWIGMDSQETTAISPAMFAEFFLPYMADVCRLFGLVYYGCCEPVHDRWKHIVEAIPNVRAVSVSPWCDLRAIASLLGKDVVYSRKPRPAPISGSAADWDALSKDLDATIEAARDCNLEIIFRDVYRIGGKRERLRRWVGMAKAKLGI